MGKNTWSGIGREETKKLKGFELAKLIYGNRNKRVHKQE